jgi:hypothetical protein
MATTHTRHLAPKSAQDVHHGAATVPWAEECHPHGQAPQPAGWVLPGGRRTLSKDAARAAARHLDTLITRNALALRVAPVFSTAN